ncbi:BTB/POZ domain-containing protein At3g22104 [Jatropha curcas]|uniref:BTB/POZ domain-containing protein At3g22104 n=1 Tax=Jatropha curcas TaxID=180498 RepID=UPI001894C8ED|nr:BTB/POZ domain-containing protein At3g22104 [Jatropha curcas]
MEIGCQLEVDVNGDEIFVMDKKVLAHFSGKLRKLFGKLADNDNTAHMKVIFQDFPGGADGFELVARFCYNNGKIEITPSNIVLLNSTAYFMEMGNNSSSSATLNLIDQTEKSLEEINYWTWSDLLVAFKQCQEIFPATNSSILLEKLLNSIVGKLAMSTASPFRFCSENFSSQLSSDASSISSTRNDCYLPTCWFQDLLFLNFNFLDKVIRMMISLKLNHVIIFKFLIFYMKSRLLSIGLDEKRQMVEAVISMLSLLDKNCLSCKGLFDILRVISSLKTIRKCYKVKLERLIGSQLDQVTLDHLLIRPPNRKIYTMYDVNLVLRLAEAYLLQGWISPSRLNKVACLIDSYLIEIALDFRLKPSTFAALLSVLPDSARKTSDRQYQAIDLYIEVHTQLKEEDKVKLYSALNQTKLSAEASQAQTYKVYITQQSKHSSSIIKLFNGKLKKNGREEAEQVLSFTIKQEHSRETGNLETHLQQMQLRVAELEKVCPMMESHMPNVAEQRLCKSGKVRSLPKLCS